MLCGGVVSFVPVVVLVFVREKTRHARLVGNKNGIKLSQQEQNAPNWEILGLLGEFCTGTGAVWLVWGEFCTGTGTVWLVWGEFCTGTGDVRGVPGDLCLGRVRYAPRWPAPPAGLRHSRREIRLTLWRRGVRHSTVVCSKAHQPRAIFQFALPAGMPLALRGLGSG